MAPTAPLAALRGVEPVGDTLILGRYHKDFLTHRGLMMEARVRAKALFQRAKTGPKFLIVCRPRSGSTLLCDLLNASPDIHCELEMLHFKVLDPRGFLNALAAKRRAKVYGCKALSYQLVEVQRLSDPRAFLERLHMDGFRMIHLRRDTLDQSLSLTRAQAGGGYHRTGPGGPAASGPARVDPGRFVRQVRWNQAMLAFETEILSELDPIVVDYEDDLLDAPRQQATLDRLCAALGAGSGTASTKYRKLARRAFAESLANAEEVAKALEAAGLGAVPPDTLRRSAG